MSGLPEIPKDTPVGLRRFLSKLKETFEVRNAQLGSPLDANPTYRDLIDAGLIKVSEDVPLLASGREFRLNTSTWITSNIPDWVTDNTIPPTPTGLTMYTNTTVITLVWDTPVFANYKQTVIYRATSNNLSEAVVIGSNTGNTYVDDLPSAGTSYFYWIRHESKSELLSDFNDTNGTTAGNVPAQPVVSYTFAGENLVLTWTTPTSSLAIQYFEISHGASVGANPVGISQSNSFRIKADFGGSRTYWVRAVDINFGLGTAGSAAVTVTSPSQPTLTQALVGNSFALTIAAAQGSLPISYYDVRYGASFAAGTPLGHTSTTRVEFEVNWTGTRTFWVVAVDSAGNSSSAASSAFNPSLPAVTNVTAQVIDNNVLLRWLATAGVLPTKTYNVYRDATLIGTDAALFAAVFESTAGTYTYKIEPIDAAGNVGTFATTTATVQQPPDFILYASQNSDLSGTKTNCFKDRDSGALYANIDTSETWTTHFTSRSWTTPQNQIDAGYTRFLVGKTTGSYLETVDYGTTIPSTKITMTPTTVFSDGTVTITPTISTSPDNSTYTDFAGVYSTFSTSFRYVKFKLDFAATHNGTGLATDTSNLIGIMPITYTLDVKLKTTQGVVSTSSSDTGGTSVDITGVFIDVQAITLTPLSTTAKHPTYDFIDVPNPTSFSVYLWDAAGSRVSGDVSYTVRGA